MMTDKITTIPAFIKGKNNPHYFKEWYLKNKDKRNRSRALWALCNPHKCSDWLLMNSWRYFYDHYDEIISDEGAV